MACHGAQAGACTALLDCWTLYKLSRPSPVCLVTAVPETSTLPPNTTIRNILTDTGRVYSTVPGRTGVFSALTCLRYIHRNVCSAGVVYAELSTALYTLRRTSDGVAIESCAFY